MTRQVPSARIHESIDLEVSKKWLNYAIFVHGSPTVTPQFPIDSKNHLLDLTTRFTGRAAYRAFGIFAVSTAGATLLLLSLTLFPGKSSAFWPFSEPADAATPKLALVASEDSAVALAAAKNTDPNPNKGLPPVSISDETALVPNAGPSGTYADVASTTGNDHISLYVVRKGDTMSDIAKMFDVSVNTIVWANNLGSAKNIHVGDALVILPISGVEHTVKKGDTLKAIASKYKANADEIAEFNGLDPAEDLAVGSTLIIPGGEVAGAAPRSSGSSSKTHVNLKNPYRGGGGIEIDGYYVNPVPGAILTQGIHGWNGIDLGARTGTPIRAAADGTVIVSRAGGWNGGYGTYVVITHPNGTQTLYSHMSTDISSVGQSVTAGQVIGYVGRTGEATGPHLHFEVRGAKNPFASCRVGTACSPK